MSKPTVFVIMPFTDEHFEIYEMLKEHFIDDFEFAHAGDDVSTQQNILKDIVQMIYDADVIIADLTGLNANVFYELDVAHTLKKKVIIISQDVRQLPFDIKSYRATEYSTHFKKFNNMVVELTRYLNGAKDGSVSFGNPVTDFLTTVNKTELSAVLFKSESPDASFAERGMIDYLADIEEEIDEINTAIETLTVDMTTMSSGVGDCTSEIERVQKTGGAGTASFMKKQARKAAGYISDYSTSQRNGNAILFAKWPSIEHSILLLLENEHINTPENREGLIPFLKSLHTMKAQSAAVVQQMESFIITFEGLKGIQSSLNQAANSVKIDIKQFIEFIEQMGASVDRIISKSRFVVGTIDFEENTLLLSTPN